MYIPSWALCLLVLIIIYVVLINRERKFSPYNVSIQPLWHKLLPDYGVIANEAVWEKILAKKRAEYEKLDEKLESQGLVSISFSDYSFIPVRERKEFYIRPYDVLYDGINFSVLFLDDEDDFVVYNKDCNLLQHTAYFSEEIEIEDVYSCCNTIVGMPELLVQESIGGGYDIGIHMPGEIVEQRIATLPDCLFFKTRQNNKHYVEKLQKNGWKWSEDRIGPERLVHKYFEVYINPFI